MDSRRIRLVYKRILIKGTPNIVPFLLMVEILSASTNKEIPFIEFVGFKVDLDDLEVSHL